MLSNMASSLILHKRIETTVAKAKAVQQFVEPLVTKSKEDTTHSRRSRSKKTTDAVEDATVVAEKKAKAPRAPKATAAKAAPVAKKTNVGKKM